MGARVLVVDDSPTIRRVVCGILAQNGYDPVGAGDGQQALEMLADAEAPRVELVLLDFVMPRMTGYELCRRIRGDASLAHLPVVLMSAKTDKIRDQFVEQTGALDAISKPFDARALITVIEATLEKVERGKTAREPEATEAPPASMARESRVPPSDPPPESRPELAASTFAARLGDLVSPILARLAAEGRVNEDDITIALSRALTAATLTPLLGPLEEWSESAGPREVLRGRGDAVPLGEILQLLQMQLQSGVLFVRQRNLEVRILFREGLIDLVLSKGTSDEFRLGRYLLAEGVVTRAQLDEIAREIAGTGKLLGDALVERSVVSEADLTRALTRQSSELIYEILRWPRARFSFQRGATFPATARLGLPVASLVMEGFQRVDEWRLIEEQIDFDGVLYRDTAAIDALGRERLGRTELAVLEAVDGERSVRDILAHTNASSFEACKILYQFLQSRLVRRRAA